MLLRRFAACGSILILGQGLAVSAAADQASWRVSPGRTSIDVDFPALDDLGALPKAGGQRQEGTLVSGLLPLAAFAGTPDDQDTSGDTSAHANTNGIPDPWEQLPLPTLTTTRVATGLTRPLYVCAPLGDLARLFIVEQAGIIKILTGGTVLATPFLNITSIVGDGGNEQGLLSMAFHPDYANNGFFFVNYTNTTGDTAIARYGVSANPNVADAGSALILETIIQDSSNHNGGQLQFGPDGYLYVGLGDGGVGGDANDRAQDLNSLLGKMLRLDVDAAAPYVPASNPFVGTDGLDEIWAYGLRNPWRFGFDRQTGDLYIGDVGEGSWEEIDFQPAAGGGGDNYGWRCYEGNNPFNAAGCDPPGTMVFPLLEYSHDIGACSVTGGYVYRGVALPGLAGTYFYADFCADWIKSFEYVGGAVTNVRNRTVELTPDVGTISSISSFGEDGAGELYICDLFGGEVFKIVEAGGGAVCGNDILEPGEQCDDGNTNPGDGCDENCQIEPGSNDACGSATVVCPGSYNGTTVAADSDGSSSCGSSGSSPDVWYRYTPAVDGTATFATCGSAYDGVLSVHTGCPGTAANQLRCDDDGCGPAGGSETITMAVTVGQTYLIRVTGYSGASGAFILTVTAPACGAGAVCGNSVVESGEDCDPPDGVTCDANCQTIVCETIIFADDFETDQGWVAQNIGASAGDWQRGVPVDDGGWAYDPISDSDGSGRCYLTQNEIGNTDVDGHGGIVRLTSPTIDMSGGNLSLRYDYYLYLTDSDGNDKLLVEFDGNDGAGPWTEIARHDTSGGTTWRSHQITQADLVAAGVTPTATVKIRFTANDDDTQSIVEGGLDAFVVAEPCGTGGISGLVLDPGRGVPIPDALVTLQATDIWTLTAVDGTFTLPVQAGTGLVVVGAKKGYFNRGLTVDVPASGVQIMLDPVPQDDDPTYQLIPPSDCGNCHSANLAQWTASPMAEAGFNTWVDDLYSGTGTPGGMGGFVYLRDSLFAGSNPNSECAACHQPEVWIANPGAALADPQQPAPPEVVHGISCDVCHKIADVNVANINYPGLFAGQAIFTRPAGPAFDQVQYGLMGDATFTSPPMMRASYQPQLVAEVCGMCHQDKNDIHQDGSFDGVISEPTYLEWVASPYGDVESPFYATCVDCHMPPSGETEVCDVLSPPLARDPITIRSHDIRGTTAAYLENAVEMSLKVQQAGTKVEVLVDLANTLTGHHVPTGMTVRNLILLVEAWPDGGDPAVNPLGSVGAQIIHDLGGIGDPAQGYYAGLAGKFYAKVTHDAQGNGPSFFTEATGITFDSRIPALTTDVTNYTFQAPIGGGLVHVRARLIYRRAFRFLVDAKGWTQDGHGNPLADVAAPHFGHLMESANGSVTTDAPFDYDGDGDVDLTDAAAWEACMTGPDNGPYVVGCDPFDGDADNDVDLDDFGGLQQAFAGP